MKASNLDSTNLVPGKVLTIPDDAYNRDFANPEEDYVQLAQDGRNALKKDRARVAEARARLVGEGQSGADAGGRSGVSWPSLARTTALHPTNDLMSLAFGPAWDPNYSYLRPDPR
ncbi:MAG: hypothetical protein QM767_22220 [Anaeromyxobacter sp.]